MKCITISREYGSGGREVASILSKKLGIPFYDSDLLVIAAEKYGIDPGLLAAYDERKSSSFLYGIAMLAEGFSNQDRIMMPYKLYQAQMDTIIRLAQEGPCIFVGRCADHILKDKCKLLNVFIYASSMEDKVQRVMKLDQLSEKEAISFIAQRDKERRDYYYFHTGQSWGDKANYDLCLNTSGIGYDGCVDVISGLWKG